MQIGEWLGFVIDTISMSFQIPEKKVSKLKGLLEAAIQAGCSTFCELARVKRVKIFTDNQGTARTVAIGSSKIHLQAVALDIFNLCLSNSIVLETQWIPRSLNEKADLLTRFVDKDDWSINPSVFQVIDAK